MRMPGKTLPDKYDHKNAMLDKIKRLQAVKDIRNEVNKEVICQPEDKFKVVPTVLTHFRMNNYYRLERDNKKQLRILQYSKAAI